MSAQGAGATRDEHGRLRAVKTHDVTVVGRVGQAVAAARLGRSVAVVAAVGDDEEGRGLRAALAAEGVDVTHAGAPDAPPGAADRLDGERVRAAAAAVSGARVVLLRCEVPDEALLAAAELCTGLLVLAPAPARPLPERLLARTDLLVPDAAELAVLAGAPVAADVEGLVAQARAVRPRGTTIVTRGERGSVVVTPGGVAEVPAPADATAATTAGDGFAVALADALLDGAGLVDAARRAARVAAVAGGRAGAPGPPPRADGGGGRGDGVGERVEVL
ncbi:PfkB family carbohydrate kinase [Kineococcus sp. SYSU DK006]|uniref:PfkB family carbohydrate kinase n=1 Tax=Kineococcus sp. SYSU DK006 TaxID=3383127 RepID=UPI003D7CDA5D